jgi:hypothetical protein
MKTKLKLQQKLAKIQQKAAELQTKIDNIKEKNIMDLVKSFEDACKLKGVKPEDIFNEKDTVDEKAYKKLKFITKVLNEDYVFKMTPDEYRYYPYFYLDSASGSGFVFRDTNYHVSNAGAASASRLCFKNSELAKHAGTYFIQEYKDFIL